MQGGEGGAKNELKNLGGQRKSGYSGTLNLETRRPEITYLQLSKSSDEHNSREKKKVTGRETGKSLENPVE